MLCITASTVLPLSFCVVATHTTVEPTSYYSVYYHDYCVQGGIQGRTEATGLGLFYATREFLQNEAFCKKHGVTPGIVGKTVIVQGEGG